jgi:hypothetical protein
MQSSWTTPLAWLVVILTLGYLSANIFYRPNAVKNWLGVMKDDAPLRTPADEIERAGLKVEAESLLRSMAGVRSESHQLDREVAQLRLAITPLLADPKVSRSRYPGLWAKATTSTVTAADMAKFEASSDQLQKVLDQPEAAGLTREMLSQANQHLTKVGKDIQDRRAAFDEIRAAFTRK